MKAYTLIEGLTVDFENQGGVVGRVQKVHYTSWCCGHTFLLESL